MKHGYSAARVGDLEIHCELADYTHVVAFEGYGHGINLLAPGRCVEEIRTFARAGA